MMVATLGIALPEIRQTFALTALQAGSLFSVMMLIAAITSAIAGRLADRIGRKTVLITGLSLLASGFGCAGISGDPLLFFLLLAYALLVLPRLRTKATASVLRHRATWTLRPE